jgi:PAS domain S-box-containing protein
VTLVGQTGSLNRQSASQIVGFATVIIAAVALIGLWTGLPMLSSWVIGSPHMRPAGALAVAVFGFALTHPGKDSRLAFGVGLVIATVAALALALVLSGVDLAVIDRWLTPWADVSGPGMLSFQVTSAGYVAIGLAGGSLALSCFERHRLASTALAALVGAIAMFALLGYLTGIDALYGTVSVNSPPLPAVVSLLCISSGIILRARTMPVLRTLRPLRRLLVMLGCAIVVPLLLFDVYSGIRIADAQLSQVRNGLMSEARTLSAEVDREIVGEIERLQALAGSPSLRQGDFAAFQRQAEASLALRQSGNIMLIDRDMQQLVNTWVPFGTPVEKPGNPAAVETAFATGRPLVTGVFIGSIIKQPVFAIIVPVQVDGENRYVLARSPGEHALARLVAANELPAGWHAAVADAGYRIMALSEMQNASIGEELPPAQRHTTTGLESIFGFVDTEGQPSLEAYTRSALTGWQTAMWAPKAVLEAPVRAQWRILGVTALLAFALVVALALWLGQIIARSVGDAARAAKALGEGGPMLPSETPVAEVDTLMTELRRSAARRKAVEDLLCESNGRLQLAINAARLGSWQYDPIRGLVLVDSRTKEIFDLAGEEATIEEVMERVHQDDAARFWADREAALDPADPQPYAHEYRVLRRDGDVRWVEGHGLAYFDGAGPERRLVGFAGTVQDITERKLREEKEHLLMREIDHRAKNMLSVVHSIAHQTAARNFEDFIERFSERVQALSANQDLLVRNEWNGGEIADLVRAQIATAHVADLIDFRIALHGPALRLNAASVQAIGLALHELVTNAGKYGALSTDAGRVDIRWGTDGDAFTMSWTECDGPPVSPPERRGFGTIVMGSMAERSVGGTVDLDYSPSGVTWRLTCPASNVREAGERAYTEGPFA